VRPDQTDFPNPNEVTSMDFEIHDRAPESKAGLASSKAQSLHDELMQMFEAFRDSNDARIAELEKRGASDVVSEDKVTRINAAIDAAQRRIDDLTLKAARPQLGRERNGTPGHDQREHKAAFEAYVRSGESAGLRALEQKAMSIGSSPDGGYLVPDEIEREIGRRLTSVSPIRSIAGVREVSASVYKKPFMTSGPATGWVGETAARPQTNTPTLAELTFPAMELYAMPATATTSRRAFSTTRWSPKAPGSGASSAMSRPAPTATSRLPRRPIR